MAKGRRFRSGPRPISHRRWAGARNPLPSAALPLPEMRPHVAHGVKGFSMNSIIYLVGLVVVVMAVLSLIGLR